MWNQKITLKAAYKMTAVIADVLPRKDWFECSPGDRRKRVPLGLSQIRGWGLKKITIPPRFLQVA